MTRGVDKEISISNEIYSCDAIAAEKIDSPNPQTTKPDAGSDQDGKDGPLFNFSSPRHLPSKCSLLRLELRREECCVRACVQTLLAGSDCGIETAFPSYFPDIQSYIYLSGPPHSSLSVTRFSSSLPVDVCLRDRLLLRLPVPFSGWVPARLDPKARSTRGAGDGGSRHLVMVLRQSKFSAARTSGFHHPSRGGNGFS